MNALEKRLERGILIADGAMGSMLIAAGLAGDGCPELLSVDEAEAIADIHLAYLAAGAGLIITHSFGGTRPKLSKYGLGERVAELSERAAANAREAVKRFGASGDTPLVAGDIGPTGEFVAPLGTLSEGDMEAIFAEQAAALAAGGADCIIVETMSALDEARAAVRAAAGVGLPVIASMSFEAGARGFRTMMGVSPEQACEGLAEAGACVVGTNCGGPIEDHIEIVRLLRAATGLPIISEPNAGLPQVRGGAVTYSHAPEDMAAKVVELANAGAGLIGACCGSTPEHLSAMVAALSSAGRLG